MILTPPGENFGKYLKVGVVEDEDVKNELAGLCRFFSKNHGEDFVSFEEYIADMKVRLISEKTAEWKRPRVAVASALFVQAMYFSKYVCRRRNR